MIRSVKQLVRHRSLVSVLVQRELKARYRGTVLGFLWSLVTPLVMMSIYSLVFSIYMRVDMEHYSLYLLAGLLPWNWFCASLFEGSSSIWTNGGLIRKVALPSEVFPLVAVISNAVHFLLSLPVLLIFLIVSGRGVSWVFLLLPLVALLQSLFCYSFAIIAGALSVQFRDLQHIIPNVVLMGMFITPIFYPIFLVPEKYHVFLHLNPLSYLIGFYHDIVYYQRMPNPVALAAILAISILLLAVSFSFFNRRKEYFAEQV